MRIRTRAGYRSRRIGVLCVQLLSVAALLAGSAAPLEAQVDEATQVPSAPATAAEPTPEISPPPPPPVPPKVDYLFPDLAPDALIYDGKRFWFKPIIAMVLDYTWFEQDDASLEQVGEQPDTRELRAGRIGGTMRWQGDYKWDLYATVDFQERGTREGAVFQGYDLRLRLPLGSLKLDIGKMKEPICLRADRSLCAATAAGACPQSVLSQPQHRSEAVGAGRRRSHDLGRGCLQRLSTTPTSDRARPATTTWGVCRRWRGNRPTSATSFTLASATDASDPMTGSCASPGGPRPT